MSRRAFGSLVVLILIAPGRSNAQHGSGGHAIGAGGAMHHAGGALHDHDGDSSHAQGAQLAAVSGGYIGYGYPIVVVSAGYPLYYNPTLFPNGPAGYFAPRGYAPGPLLPPPPRDLVPRPNPPPRVVVSDSGRASRYVTFGDRLFRAGNIKRAEERYRQAVAAAPDEAAAHVRLAQIALVRGQFTEAADHLRDAETVEPGWLATASDIQALYGEPGNFHTQLARLESHVQSHPDDRDAWLVLGAQWFLSGRKNRAADVFLRLDDPRRKPDVALAAFQFASEQSRGAPDAAKPADRAMP